MRYLRTLVVMHPFYRYIIFTLYNYGKYVIIIYFGRCHIGLKGII